MLRCYAITLEIPFTEDTEIILTEDRPPQLQRFKNSFPRLISLTDLKVSRYSSAESIFVNFILRTFRKITNVRLNVAIVTPCITVSFITFKRDLLLVRIGILYK